MKKINIILVFLCLALLGQNAFANIEGVYKVIIQKQVEKKSSRWTLADWLSTKKKMALMDQWLALNTKTTSFEARIGGMSGNVEQKTNGENTQEKNVSRYEVELLIKMIGLAGETGQLSPSLKSTSGEIQLMLLGSSLQSTHLRAFYGQRNLKWEGVSDFKSPYYGGILTLYLFDFFGTEARYQKFSKQQGTDQTFESEGEALSTGIFLDLAFLRIGAKFFRENLRLNQNAFFHSRLKNEATLLTASLFF